MEQPPGPARTSQGRASRRAPPLAVSALVELQRSRSAGRRNRPARRPLPNTCRISVCCWRQREGGDCRADPIRHRHESSEQVREARFGRNVPDPSCIPCATPAGDMVSDSSDFRERRTNGGTSLRRPQRPHRGRREGSGGQGRNVYGIRLPVVRDRRLEQWDEVLVARDASIENVEDHVGQGLPAIGEHAVRGDRAEDDEHVAVAALTRTLESCPQHLLERMVRLSEIVHARQEDEVREERIVELLACPGLQSQAKDRISLEKPSRDSRHVRAVGDEGVPGGAVMGGLSEIWRLRAGPPWCSLSVLPMCGRGSLGGPIEPARQLRSCLAVRGSAGPCAAISHKGPTSVGE